MILKVMGRNVSRMTVSSINSDLLTLGEHYRVTLVLVPCVAGGVLLCTRGIAEHGYLFFYRSCLVLPAVVLTSKIPVITRQDSPVVWYGISHILFTL